MLYSVIAVSILTQKAEGNARANFFSSLSDGGSSNQGVGGYQSNPNSALLGAPKNTKSESPVLSQSNYNAAIASHRPLSDGDSEDKCKTTQRVQDMECRNCYFKIPKGEGDPKNGGNTECGDSNFCKKIKFTNCDSDTYRITCKHTCTELEKDNLAGPYHIEEGDLPKLFDDLPEQSASHCENFLYLCKKNEDAEIPYCDCKKIIADAKQREQTSPRKKVQRHYFKDCWDGQGEKGGRKRVLKIKILADMGFAIKAVEGKGTYKDAAGRKANDVQELLNGYISKNTKNAVKEVVDSMISQANDVLAEQFSLKIQLADLLIANKQTSGYKQHPFMGDVQQKDIYGNYGYCGPAEGTVIAEKRTSAEERLNSFHKWVTESEPNNEYAAYYLLTSCKSTVFTNEDSTRNRKEQKSQGEGLGDREIIVHGKAVTAGACKPEKNVGFVSSYDMYNDDKLAIIFAHEIGHTLGADHYDRNVDEHDDDDDDEIMRSGENTVNSFRAGFVEHALVTMQFHNNIDKATGHYKICEAIKASQKSNEKCWAYENTPKTN